MELNSGRIERLPKAAREDRRRPLRRDTAPRLAAVLAVWVALVLTTVGVSAGEPLKAGQGRGLSHFPTVPAEHKHVHALLENAMHFVAPRHQMVDAISGY